MNTRISKLEERVRSQAQTKIWVDWTDCRARIDVNDRRGKEKTFPNPFECKDWIENQISKAARVRGTAFISDISELFGDKKLQAAFGAAWGDMERPGVMMNLGAYQGEDLAERALNTYIFMRFNTTRFHEKWFAKETTPEDERVLDALYLLYSFLHPRTPEVQEIGFAMLVYATAKLGPLEKTDDAPEVNP